MNENISRLNESRSRDVARRMTLRDHIVDLFERHGEDYAVEGKRLLRRLARTVAVVGILLVVLTGSLVALVIHALLH